jgi:hypothetical protein
VEFYPSADDYVHIASKIGAEVPTPPLIKYSYLFFLLLNTVGFPAFLWFNDFLLAGVLLLALNIVALQWVIPWFTTGSLRKYYEHTMGPREKSVARVELSAEGVSYSSDEAETFWPWRRILAIEETDEAIYFYFLGNGFAVRKSGFAYRDEQVAFMNAATGYLAESKTGRLEA